MSINGPSMLCPAISTCIVTLWKLTDNFTGDTIFQEGLIDSLRTEVHQEILFQTVWLCWSLLFVNLILVTLLLFFNILLLAFTSSVVFSSCLTVIDWRGHDPLCWPKKILYSIYSESIKLLCGEDCRECQATWAPYRSVTGFSLKGSRLPDTTSSPSITPPSWTLSPLLQRSSYCQGHKAPTPPLSHSLPGSLETSDKIGYPPSGNLPSLCSHNAALPRISSSCTGCPFCFPSLAPILLRSPLWIGESLRLGPDPLLFWVYILSPGNLIWTSGSKSQRPLPHRSHVYYHPTHKKRKKLQDCTTKYNLPFISYNLKNYLGFLCFTFLRFGKEW